MNGVEVVRSLYAAINQRDVDAAMAYIDDRCVYQDFNFSQPFEGKAAVRELLTDSCSKTPQGLMFVIDDITEEIGHAAGLIWHVELDGIPFPNGRGASFYRISPETGKIVFARDVVEPPVKPGKVAFGIIRLVAPLVKRFLQQKQ